MPSRWGNSFFDLLCQHHLRLLLDIIYYKKMHLTKCLLFLNFGSQHTKQLNDNYCYFAVDGHLHVTKDVSRLVKLGQQCMDRAANIITQATGRLPLIAALVE